MNINKKELFWVYDSVNTRFMFSGVGLHAFLNNIRELNWSFIFMGLLLFVSLYYLAVKKSNEIELDIKYKRDKFQKSLLYFMGYSASIYVLSGVLVGVIAQNFEISLTGFLFALTTFLIVTSIQKSICQSVTKKINYDPDRGCCIY